MSFHFPNTSKSSPPQWILYLLLVVAIFSAYANVYDNDFLFDDTILIKQNMLLRHWQTFGDIFMFGTSNGAGNPGGFYRPLQSLLYFLVYQIAGPTPVGFHLLNISLHAINASALYALGRKLGFGQSAAFLGALIWALHPAHTEAITYMSGTADPLYVFFCLCGLLIIVPDFAPRRILAACPLFILALLSKEAAIVLPLLAMVCLFLLSEKRRDPRTYMRVRPLALVAVLYLAARFTWLSQYGSQSFDRPAYHYLKLYADHFSYRLMTFLATLPTYFGILIWPVDLHMERMFPVMMDPRLPPVIAGAGMVLAALGILVWGRVRPLSWGILWFAAALSPATGLVIPVNAFVCEHWLYLPSSGLIMGLARMMQVIVDRYSVQQRATQMLVIVALGVALVLGLRTHDQNKVWHDTFTFYTHILRYGDGSERAHNNLGIAYVTAGDYDQAILQFRQAISIADTLAEAHVNLALTLIHVPDRRAHMAEAIDELNRALAIDPQFYRADIALTLIYQLRKAPGDSERAAQSWNKAEEIRQKIAPFLDYKDILSQP